MKELLRTADPVHLSYVQAVLGGAGIESVVLDGNVGAVFGGALAQRVMVEEEDFGRAVAALRQADEAAI